MRAGADSTPSRRAVGAHLRVHDASSRRQSFVSRFGGISGSNLACVILKNCCSSAVSLSVTRRSAAGATNSARASHIASKRLAANLAAHGILTKSSLRCAVSLICSGGQCDQHGAELDILLQKRRDKAAAKRFFNRVLAACADAPRRIDRSIAQLSGRKGRHSRTGKHQTRLRQGCGPGEQPCRKQPSAYA
ncbi:hypothetical protein QFZ97_007311 [Paraburkholderia youngii]